MRVTRVALLVISVVLALVATNAGASLLAPAVAPGLPAQVIDFQPEVQRIEAYASTTFTADGPVEGTTEWRVNHGTGNGAENWLHATADGRIYDFGGRYLNYTDDDGQTWESVRPLEPLVNGEGAVVAAPNGDIVGVTWDPYAGDRVWTFKYTKATDTWEYQVDPFHTPFWDRPGIDVIPGDFTTPTGEQVPYITLIKGFPHELWHYSYDGLNYPFTTSRAVDGSRTDAISEWLDVEPDPSYDWIQPLPVLGGSVIPVGDGKGVGGSMMFSGEDMAWHDFTLPEGRVPSGITQVDSRGWLHNVVRAGEDAIYTVSTDGGRSWSDDLVLPGINPGDLKANAAAGVAAVSGLEGLQDVAYKIDITTDEPALVQHYTIGDGGSCRCSGIGFYGVQGGNRFDFHTVVILSDGRLALSFMDSTTLTSFPTVGTEIIAPAMAVELPSPADPVVPEVEPK